MTISIYAHKGGVGVTTVTAALAIETAKTRFSGEWVTISAELAECEDLCAVLGLGQPVTGPDGETAPIEMLGIGIIIYPLASSQTPPEPDFIVGYRGGENITRYVVTRCCYVASRREAFTRKEWKPDGLIVIVEPGRALTPNDVSAAIGAPVVAEIPWDPTIARVIDAGMLAGRVPASLARPIHHLIP